MTNPRSIESERKFRERVAALGGTLVDLTWRGASANYHVVCACGHDRHPRADSVIGGGGICRVCGRSTRSIDSERRFRERVADLGATILEPAWLGSTRRHRLRCAAGHPCSPLPSNVLKGRGICLICVGIDPAQSWSRFRARVVALGGTVVEPEWLGSHTRHRVICRAGHECAPFPHAFSAGRTPICRTCSRRDPADAWRRFRARVEVLGGEVVETAWLGARAPHRVRCAAGHECQPHPVNVLRGIGICNACSFAACDAFYVVEHDTSKTIKIGITTGEGAGRLRDHRRAGFGTVLRFLPGLSDASCLEQHLLKTLAVARIRPARGREYFHRSALAVVLDIVDNWQFAGSDDKNAT